MDQEQGLRYNEGKIRYTLAHPFAHKQMIEVFEKGARKYGVGNWQKGMKWSTVLQSLERHLMAIKQGEDIDPETGLLHAAHLQCNAHMLTSYYQIYPQGDDRINNQFINPRIGLDLDGVVADFINHFYSYLNLPNQPPLYWNDSRILNNFHRIKNNDDFWLSIPVLEKPLFEPCVYVTARPCSVDIVKQWIDINHLPQAPIHVVDKAEDKLPLIKTLELDYFVEDNYSTFTTLNNEGVKTFLRSQSYNTQYSVGNLRVSSLKEVFDKIFQYQ